MLKTRILAALVFTPPLVGLVWWGGFPLEVTCLVLTFLMSWEFGRLTLAEHGGWARWSGIGFSVSFCACVLGWLPLEVVLPALVLLALGLAVAQPLPYDAARSRVGSWRSVNAASSSIMRAMKRSRVEAKTGWRSAL